MSVNMIESETVTVKKGQDVINFRMNRGRKGISVFLKLDPSIEKMFEEWGAGRKIETGGPHSHGKMLEAVDGSPLTMHSMAGGVEGWFTSPEGPYNLLRVGVPLTDDSGVNLGFLRIVGASSGEGVNFVVKGVYSAEAVREAGRKIKSALQHFYINFVKPIDVVITMSSSEL